MAAPCGIIRLEHDRLATGCNRFRELAMFVKGTAQVHMGLGILRLQPDGLSTGVDGLVEPVLVAQRTPKVGIRLGMVRLQANAPDDTR